MFPTKVEWRSSGSAGGQDNRVSPSQPAQGGRQHGRLSSGQGGGPGYCLQCLGSAPSSPRLRYGPDHQPRTTVSKKPQFSQDFHIPSRAEYFITSRSQPPNTSPPSTKPLLTFLASQEKGSSEACEPPQPGCLAAADGSAPLSGRLLNA